MKDTGWGAIFDWDGVVVDSGPQHKKAWEILAAEEKRPLAPDHFQHTFGMRNEQVIPECYRWTTAPEEIRRISLKKEAIYRDLLRREGVDVLPGVVEWLTRLRQAGIPAVIGSSTHRANLEAALEKLPIRHFFQGMVAGEDVRHGKPHPEVFQLSAAKLSLPPSRCVVFEDTLVGIRAAHAAAARAVAVTTSFAAGELAVADIVVRRLDDLDVETLGAWFGTDSAWKSASGQVFKGKKTG
ncbi:MAG: HAD-IA family hydrolase [Verrucomicrobiae bacterium]|nr:HAD-IA family hydrolase [Verrucomicrobiae bacterium]